MSSFYQEKDSYKYLPRNGPFKVSPPAGNPLANAILYDAYISHWCKYSHCTDLRLDISLKLKYHCYFEVSLSVGNSVCY